jgi:hypothetical protein
MKSTDDLSMRHRSVRRSDKEPSEMTNEFLVQAREILLIDECDFRAHGGVGIRFGRVDGDVVSLLASGTNESIRYLAGAIRVHGTAAG